MDSTSTSSSKDTLFLVITVLGFQETSESAATFLKRDQFPDVEEDNTFWTKDFRETHFSTSFNHLVVIKPPGNIFRTYLENAANRLVIKDTAGDFKTHKIFDTLTLFWVDREGNKYAGNKGNRGYVETSNTFAYEVYFKCNSIQVNSFPYQRNNEQPCKFESPITLSGHESELTISDTTTDMIMLDFSESTMHVKCIRLNQCNIKWIFIKGFGRDSFAKRVQTRGKKSLKIIINETQFDTFIVTSSRALYYSTIELPNMVSGNLENSPINICLADISPRNSSKEDDSLGSLKLRSENCSCKSCF